MLDVTEQQVFTDRFNRLYADAGEPTYESVARGAAKLMRPDQAGRLPRLSKQRIADWRRGRVPKEFAPIGAVIALLIKQAHARKPVPAMAGLYDMKAWQTLWDQTRKANQSGTGASDQARAGSGAAPAALACPYRGLAAFEAEHADFFFGRTDSTRELVSRVDELVMTGGLLMLIADSGAGKSSLLGAGLDPAIRAGMLLSAGSSRWPILSITPGSDPIGSLTRHIPGLAEARRQALGDKVGDGSWEQDAGDGADRHEGLVRAAITRHAADAEGSPGTGSRVVIIVDQFEELFTLCESESQRREFIATLQAAAREPGAPAVVVLGMRADFYHRCLPYPALREALQQRNMVLGPMTVEELTEAITGPARAVGLKLETSLADQLIQEARNRPVGKSSQQAPVETEILPLLSHALRATWQFRDRNRLTLAGYRRTGGIHGAVSQTAERALARLDPEGRAEAMSLLIRMTRVGEDSRDTRMRCDKRDLIEASGRADIAESALEELVQARLVTVDTTSAQIAHEALLHAWPTLRRHLDQHRIGLVALQRLEDDAAVWVKNGRAPSWLYRGDKLTDAQGWVQTEELAGPSSIAQQFIHHAIVERDQAAAERRRRRRRDRRVVGAIAALAIVGLTLAAVAFVLRQVAEHHEDDAIFTTVVAQADRLQASDTSLAALLDLSAYRMRATPDRYTDLISTDRAPLATVLARGAAPVRTTAFSPDKRTLAGGNADGTVQLWDVSNSAHPTALGQPVPGNTQSVRALAFSPDARTLAIAGDDGRVRLLNVSDPAHPEAVGTIEPPVDQRREGQTTSGIHASGVSTVAFNTDARTLVTGDANGTVQLWDVSNPARPTSLGPPLLGDRRAVIATAFSPDGRTLASAGADNLVRLWNVTDPARPQPLGAPLTASTKAIYALAFSPDGRTLASAGADKLIWLWNLADLNHPAPWGPALPGNTNAIYGLAFSPDSRTLVSAGADNLVRLWNVTNPAQANLRGDPLAGHSRGVAAVAISPDGWSLASAGADGTLRLWALPPVLTGHDGPVDSIAFSPDKRTLASAGADGTLRLWNVTDPARPSPLGAPLVPGSRALITTAFSADGKLLAATGVDGVIWLWNVANPARPVPLGTPLRASSKALYGLAFSPDGHTLASAGADNLVRLWSLTPAGATPIATFSPDGRAAAAASGHPSGVGAIAFSPDSHTLACGSQGDTVRLWDVRDAAHPVPGAVAKPAHTAFVSSTEFSPDGHTLATASADHTIKLWAVTDPGHLTSLGPPLIGHANPVTDVTFSPDRHTMASSGGDGTVTLWNVSDPAHATMIGKALAASTDGVRSIAFSPDSRTFATAGRDETAQLWSTDVERSIHRICRTTANNLTPEKWSEIVSGGRTYEPPCP